jgi:outer membrane protein assembly factor BamB
VSSGARHGALVEVELVEEDVLPTHGLIWPAPRLAPMARVVAVVLAACVVVQGAATAGAARALTALGAAGAVLTNPPTDGWRAAGVLLGVAGDLAVLDDKRRGVEALDVASGRMVWRVPEAGSCRLVTLDEPERPGPPVAARASRARLVCGWAPGQLDHDATDVAILDPATGSRLARVSIPGSAGWWFIVHGDVLLVAAAPSGSLRATRLDAETGQPVWTYRSPEPVVTPGGAFTASGQDAAELTASGALGSVRLALGSGTEAARSPGLDAADADIRLPLDGALALGGWDAAGTPTVAVVGNDGRLRWSRPGYLPVPPVDDASDPGVVVMEPADPTSAAGATGLIGVDAGTGAQLWHADAPTTLTARAAGVLVAADRHRIVALDARTGQVLWAAVPYGDGCVTDGRTVMTIELRHGHSTLVARDLRSGVEVWQRRARAELWPGVARYGGDSLVTLPGGIVVLQTDSEVITMRSG